MIKIAVGDCLERMREFESESVNCCVTSPPYFGLRDYGHAGQIGLEKSPEQFVAKLVEVFREVRRVLRDDGTLWLNLGDSYAGGGGFSPNSPSNQKGSKQTTHKGSIKGAIGVPTGLKPKDLIGIPWRVAFALQADGWYLRQDIIWSKPNPMPESVTDRCTKAHEYIFLFSKKPKYYYDYEAIKEPAQNWGTRDRSEMREGTTDPKLKHHGLKGKEWEENPTKNKRSVWTVTDRKSTRLNSSHIPLSRMPSSA